MELLSGILSIIVFVFGILNIILFFKIWGMTNDVSAIKEYLLSNKLNSTKSSTYKEQTEEDTISEETESQVLHKELIKTGDRVRHTTYYTDRIMIVGTINSDGSCMCLDENGNTFGTFSLDKLVKV